MSESELQLPPQYRFVALARLVVVAAARNAGMDEARREDLRIAVSEATTSAIATMEASTPRAPVVLRFGDGDGAFRVTVRGAGRGHGPEAERDGWPTGNGLAATVIRGLADEVEFVPCADGSVDLCFALSLTGTGGDRGNGPGQPSGRARAPGSP